MEPTPELYAISHKLRITPVRPADIRPLQSMLHDCIVIIVASRIVRQRQWR